MHPLHFQVERKILRTKPSLDFSLANVDMTLVCQAKGETTYIPLLLSSQLVFSTWQSFLIPLPGTFLHTWSFCLRHFDFSASSASGVFYSLLQTSVEPLTFLPPSLLPPKSQKWTLFFSLCFLPISQIPADWCHTDRLLLVGICSFHFSIIILVSWFAFYTFLPSFLHSSLCSFPHLLLFSIL